MAEKRQPLHEHAELIENTPPFLRIRLVRRLLGKAPLVPPAVQPNPYEAAREDLQIQAGQLEYAEEQIEAGRKTRKVRQRDAQGHLIGPRPLFPKWVLPAAGAGLLVVIALFFFLGRATSGGSSAAPAAEPTLAPAALAPTDTGSGADINNTAVLSETGSVLLTGDMRLKIKSNGAEAELSVASMQDGPYSLGDQVIGTISTDAATGGKRLSYNGNSSVSVRLFKVDPALAPVSFTLGTRAFTVLAQLDGNFHLVTLGDGGKDWGTFAPPEPIDIGETRIATNDAGDSIEITFPAKPAVEPAATPAPQG